MRKGRGAFRQRVRRAARIGSSGSGSAYADHVGPIMPQRSEGASSMKDEKDLPVHLSDQARFEEYQAQHLHSVAAALSMAASDGDNDDSSEKNGVDGSPATAGAGLAARWERLVAGYVRAGGAAEKENVSSLFGGGVQVEQLLGSHETVCLICLETVQAADGVWSCRQCSVVLHLTCTQSWVSQRALPRSHTLSAAAFPDREVPWLCPKCREEYSPGEVPKKATCWCAKVVDPPFDPWTAPHSCGETCGKALLLPSTESSARRVECGHRCVVQCHPGRCPPCPRVIPSSCYCGKEEQTRRCAQRSFSCDGMCGKMLSCGQHACERTCHDGDCGECPRTSSQTCRCGSETAQRPCAEREFRCQRVCEQPLPCGTHTCRTLCCSGQCDMSACPGQTTRKCPCGNRSFGPTAQEGLRCTEEPPVCRDSTCGRPLLCRDPSHVCADRCHRGQCPPCRAQILQKCRCGSTQKQVECALTVLGGAAPAVQCNKRCAKQRLCGVHACNRRCCPGDCESAPCPEICGKVRRCGNTSHRCTEPCHPGACEPCAVQITYSCACGDTNFRIPCGAERHVTEPPSCESLCRRPPLCHHPTVRPHQCHFGPCPPCKYVCSIRHEGQPNIHPDYLSISETYDNSCGHLCRDSCHDKPDRGKVLNPEWDFKTLRLLAANNGQSTKAQKRAARLLREQDETNPHRIDVTKASETCPPCSERVKRQCRGKHEVYNVLCKTAKEFPCERNCQNWKHCGNHKCELGCHDITVRRVREKSEDGPARTQQGFELDVVWSDDEEELPQDEAVELSSAGEASLDELEWIEDSCEPCNEPCSRPRDPGCRHACEKACHPEPCGVCKRLVKFKCFCGSIMVPIECHLTSNKALVEKRKRCGNTCLRPMECGHKCQRPCHDAKCETSGSPCEMVTKLYCACRRVTQKQTCARARRRKGVDGIDAKTGLPVLPCEDKCRLAKAEKTEADRQAREKQEAERVRREAEEREKAESKLNRRKKPRRVRRTGEAEEQAPAQLSLLEVLRERAMSVIRPYLPLLILAAVLTLIVIVIMIVPR